MRAATQDFVTGRPQWWERVPPDLIAVALQLPLLDSQVAREVGIVAAHLLDKALASSQRFEPLAGDLASGE